MTNYLFHCVNICANCIKARVGKTPYIFGTNQDSGVKICYILHSLFFITTLIYLNPISLYYTPNGAVNISESIFIYLFISFY